VHAADAPRPISTGKLLDLQETAVTKPHRIKTCDKKEETQKNVHTMQWRAAPSAWHEGLTGHVCAQRNKYSRRVKQCHAVKRKAEALPRLMAKLPRLMAKLVFPPSCHRFLSRCGWVNVVWMKKLVAEVVRMTAPLQVPRIDDSVSSAPLHLVRLPVNKAIFL
jgi:hypothetical protein